MGREIERKFLVSGQECVEGCHGVKFRQGYIRTVSPGMVVRVRVGDSVGWLTIKGKDRGIGRLEYEYAIPVSDAHEMLERLCEHPLIEKKRYEMEYEGHTWEVDVFEGQNRGLVIAEVELDSAEEPVGIPPWVVKEVTDDPRYSNVYLAKNPYCYWPDREEVQG